MLDIAILEGVRTPFARAFGPLADVPAQELGRIAAERRPPARRAPAGRGRSGHLRQCLHAGRLRQHRSRHRPAGRRSSGSHRATRFSAIVPPVWRRSARPPA